jgi:hypothetical protein
MKIIDIKEEKKDSILTIMKESKFQDPDNPDKVVILEKGEQIKVIEKIEEEDLPPILKKAEKAHNDKVLDWEKVQSYYIVSFKKRPQYTAILDPLGNQIIDVDTWEDAKNWIKRNTKRESTQNFKKEYNNLSEEESVDVEKVIKDLANAYGDSNEAQGKMSQLIRGLAFSDDPKANEFMELLDKATTEISKKVLGD